MKILITGSTGLLGRELVKKFSRHSLLLPSSNELNVTNAAQVYRFCRENKPDIIIHSAAYTNVDACEINPELAFAVNADGSKNIARALTSQVPGSLEFQVIMFLTESLTGLTANTMSPLAPYPFTAKVNC